MAKHTQRTKARLNNRVRAILMNGPMRSDDIHSVMLTNYGHEKWCGLGSVATLSQTLKQSGMFRRAYWETSTGRQLDGSLSATEHRRLGNGQDIISVWENKTMAEIIEPWLTKTHTRRKLSNMPATVREAVEQARGEQE